MLWDFNSIASISTELWPFKHWTYPHGVRSIQQYAKAIYEIWSDRANKGTSEIVFPQFAAVQKKNVALTRAEFENENCDKVCKLEF